MGITSFQVQLTSSAVADLHEIDDYWFRAGEPDRGEQYVRDLTAAAEAELATPIRALAGRLLDTAILPGTRQILVFKGSYRIIYRVAADEGVVYVLRFWHSHRDEPDLT
jgi:plasmid stabilization system protein ParE